MSGRRNTRNSGQGQGEQDAHSGDPPELPPPAPTPHLGGIDEGEEEYENVGHEPGGGMEENIVPWPSMELRAPSKQGREELPVVGFHNPSHQQMLDGR